MAPRPEYHVCLSYASEDRPYVERVAANLLASGVSVFYDGFEEAALWGKDLYEHLDRIYRHDAHLCVMFVSKSYAQKVWTNHERRSAQARAVHEQREYLLPARFDDTHVPGLPDSVAYVDLTRRTAEEFADMVRAKLTQLGVWQPGAESTAESAAPSIREVVMASVQTAQGFWSTDQGAIDRCLRSGRLVFSASAEPLAAITINGIHHVCLTTWGMHMTVTGLLRTKQLHITYAELEHWRFSVTTVGNEYHGIRAGWSYYLVINGPDKNHKLSLSSESQTIAEVFCRAVDRIKSTLPMVTTESNDSIK